MNRDYSSALRSLRQLVTSIGEFLKEQCTGIDYVSVGTDYVDVSLGLLARQYQVWASLLWDPLTWKPVVAPLLLRGLVDGLITLSWIADHPESALTFKIYSAGRLKLQAELRSEIASRIENSEALSEEANVWNQMSDEEVWKEVSPVLLSNWNSRDIRTMADEAGLLDLYNLYYGPLSSNCHAEWMTLRNHFLMPCSEPLHRPHWLPDFLPNRGLNSDAPYLATDLMWMSIKFTLEGLGLEYEEQFWEQRESETKTALNAFR